MTRARLMAFALLSLSACEVQLEPRSYACDPFLTDGGVQCTAGWSCGLDNKCFDRTPKETPNAWAWQCEDAGHCPAQWQCGVRLNDAGFCQLLDAGYPSQCLDSSHCQGGWRCGAEQRCFDPAIPDGGTTRRCTTTDGGNDECPFGFRCGQRVANEQFCIELDAGAPSLCTTDDGCEGERRCDTVVQRCVVVSDVIDPGTLTNLIPDVKSPLRTTPAPRLLSVSRLTTLPPELVDRPSGPANGFIIGELFDGGVRISALNKDRKPLDGGRQAPVVSRFVPFDVSNAAELVVTANRIAVLTDAGLSRVQVWSGRDAGQLFEQPALGVRAFTQVLRGPSPHEALLVGVGQKVVREDDSDLGPGGVTIVEYVELHGFAYAIDEDGVAHVRELDGGVWAVANQTGRLSGPLRSTQLVTGTNEGAPAMAVVLDSPTGPVVVPYLPLNANSLRSADRAFEPCPEGASPMQVSFSVEPTPGRQGGVVARCARTDGGSSFTAFNRFATAGPGPMWRVKYEPLSDELVPYAAPVTVAKSNPLMRAHAAKNGRVWFTPDLDATGDLGLQALVPLVLDRQPDTVVNVSVLGGVLATSGRRLFEADREVGFCGATDVNPFVVLGLFSNEATWLVTSDGLLNLATINGGSESPTEFARVTGGVLTSPISAFRTEALLEGSPRTVALIASGDSVWASDVTTSKTGQFVTPSALGPVFVPQPGVRLRSLTLVNPERPDGGLGAGVSGYIATATNAVRQRRPRAVAAHDRACAEELRPARRGVDGARAWQGRHPRRHHLVAADHGRPLGATREPRRRHPHRRRFRAQVRRPVRRDARRPLHPRRRTGAAAVGARPLGERRPRLVPVFASLRGGQLTLRRYAERAGHRGARHGTLSLNV